MKWEKAANQRHQIKIDNLKPIKQTDEMGKSGKPATSYYRIQLSVTMKNGIFVYQAKI
jgi:hypothetical protein